MPEVMRINTENAKLNPEGQFGGPQELAETIGLTTGEKIAALDRWATSVELRLNATSEGMEAPKGETSHDAELLRQIHLARRGLIEDQ